MTKEEQAVRMWLLDKSPEEQEFYRNEMNRLFTIFQRLHERLQDSHKVFYVAALGIAVVKFTQYVGGKDE